MRPPLELWLNFIVYLHWGCLYITISKQGDAEASSANQRSCPYSIHLIFLISIKVTKKVSKVKKVEAFIRERPKLHPVTSQKPVERPSRYPKRCPRINYEEADVPDDDHYLCEYFIFFH